MYLGCSAAQRSTCHTAGNNSHDTFSKSNNDSETIYGAYSNSLKERYKHLQQSIVEEITTHFMYSLNITLNAQLVFDHQVPCWPNKVWDAKSDLSQWINGIRYVLMADITVVIVHNKTYLYHKEC